MFLYSQKCLNLRKEIITLILFSVAVLKQQKGEKVCWALGFRLQSIIAREVMGVGGWENSCNYTHCQGQRTMDKAHMLLRQLILLLYNLGSAAVGMAPPAKDTSSH